MAHHKSAKKRIRGNAAKNVRNRSYLSSVKTAITKFKSSLEAGDKLDNAKTLLLNAQSLIDRAASKGLIHRNNASRNVTRLTKLLVKAQSGTLVKATSKGSKAKKG